MNLHEVWQQLEIAETKDKSLIKKAYATKLKTINLQTQVKAFKFLRQAYEIAMVYAERGVAPTNEEEQVKRVEERSGVQLAERYVELLSKEGEQKAIENFKLWQHQGKLDDLKTKTDFEYVVIYYLARLKTFYLESVELFFNYFDWKAKSNDVYHCQDAYFRKVVESYFALIYLINVKQKLLSSKSCVEKLVAKILFDTVKGKNSIRKVKTIHKNIIIKILGNSRALIAYEIDHESFSLGHFTWLWKNLNRVKQATEKRVIKRIIVGTIIYGIFMIVVRILVG